ncbi:WXG100 family type VII secretion target [Oerskovia flava]|uniref:WXG100 family type VII secretion target n=1 Tax=Oerskovia flava TaxID=2986422 RepID=UPI00223EA099|nr:WXG100 family type VII secretion target [Oerskovia sp. JB1-3-2]
MSDMWGADVEGLRRLAAELDGSAQSLTSLASRLSSVVASTGWTGRDSDEFRGVWDGMCMEALRSCAVSLSGAAESLRLDADQQESASTDGSEGAGGATPSVVPGHGGGGGGVGGPVAMVVPVSFSPTAPMSPGDPDTSDPGDAPGVAGGEHYVVGDPTRPDLEWDEDFEYASDDNPTWDDRMSWAEWNAKGEATRVHPGLQDAGAIYRHYLDNSGEDYAFDYASAYESDASVTANVDAEVANAQLGAEELIAQGHTNFSMTGDASAAPHYPETENWQKTIGGYQQWSSADVTVDGDQASMVVTVHAEDRYNFNAGQADIASGAPDDVNGRFTELGWAQPFNSSGSVQFTVTWTIGDAESVLAEPVPEER